MAEAISSKRVENRDVLSVNGRFEIQWEKVVKDHEHLSLLGSYVNYKPTSGWWVDRREGKMHHDGKVMAKNLPQDHDRRTWRYWIPNEEVYGPTAEHLLVKSFVLDFKRMEAYQHGEWWFQACTVKFYVGDLLMATAGPAPMESDSGSNLIECEEDLISQCLARTVESVDGIIAALEATVANLRKLKAETPAKVVEVEIEQTSQMLEPAVA